MSCQETHSDHQLPDSGPPHSSCGSYRYSPRKITEAELGETETRALEPHSCLAAFAKYASPELSSFAVWPWDLLADAKLAAVMRITAIMVFIETAVPIIDIRSLSFSTRWISVVLAPEEGNVRMNTISCFTISQNLTSTTSPI